jgi:hypothetical protein
MDIFLPENRTSYFPEKGTFKILLDNSFAFSWLDTRMYVKKGDQITITASGTACNGENSCAGPEGNPDYGLYNGCQIGSLIARIDSGESFCVGENFQMTAQESGLLYLSYNDTDYLNNAGEFNVTVNVTPK